MSCIQDSHALFSDTPLIWLCYTASHWQIEHIQCVLSCVIQVWMLFVCVITVFEGRLCGCGIQIRGRLEPITAFSGTPALSVCLYTPRTPVYGHTRHRHTREQPVSLIGPIQHQSKPGCLLASIRFQAASLVNTDKSKVAYCSVSCKSTSKPIIERNKKNIWWRLLPIMQDCQSKLPVSLPWEPFPNIIRIAPAVFWLTS